MLSKFLTIRIKIITYARFLKTTPSIWTYEIISISFLSAAGINRQYAVQTTG